MRIVNTDEIRSIEEGLKGLEINSNILIENFGVNGARFLDREILKSSKDVQIITLIGPGKNGADGLCVSKHLLNLGYNVRVFKLFRDADCLNVLKEEIQTAAKYGLSVNEISSSLELEEYYSQIDSKTMLIDAIFGTGLKGDLPNFLYDIINFVNNYESFITSIDIPSGVNSDNGLVKGNAIKATLTLANSFAKQGYFMSDGVHKIGTVKAINSGFPVKTIGSGNKFLLNERDILNTIDPRDKFGDKKVFGHTLVIGGSHGLTGALVLASSASLRVGAGLVTAATWEPQYKEFLSRLIPDIMTGFIPLEVERWPNLIKGLDKYSAIVIGPGLARSTRARRLVLEVLNNFSGPVVLDADAINVLSLKEDKNVFKDRSAPTVLTPHLGEFAKFAGIDSDEVSENPVKCLKELISKINCTVILKGACSFLGLTDGNIYFNYSPNDGMATGGAGDVLAGILGGLLAQKSLSNEKVELSKRYEELNKTVINGVLLHTLSGKEASKEYGVRSMSASSLIDSLKKVFLQIDNKFETK